MNNTLAVIENVIRDKLRGKVFYQSSFSALMSDRLICVKPFDLPSGKGYQRPVDKKRCIDFANYLSKGDSALFTPVLLNAASNWEFTAYDRQRPNFGRLLCKGPASLMDGQHRLGGVRRFIHETQMEIVIPFLAFHFLDEDEEIMLFDTINTKAKGIGTSLSKYLHRDSDDLGWISTQMLTRRESPFYEIGSIIGKRTNTKHVTLQNIYRFVSLLTAKSDIADLKKEEKLSIAMCYYSVIKECFTAEWNDYKNFRLSHIVILDSLSIAGNTLLNNLFTETKKLPDAQKVKKQILKLSDIDWSSEGPLKYVRGRNGSKQLSTEIKSILCAK